MSTFIVTVLLESSAPKGVILYYRRRRYHRCIGLIVHLPGAGGIAFEAVIRRAAVDVGDELALRMVYAVLGKVTELSNMSLPCFPAPEAMITITSSTITYATSFLL